jgi:acyl-CoA thioesterase II
MTGLEELVSILDIEVIGQNQFRGAQPSEERSRVFGGQVIAQALMAAYRTIESRSVHSLQSYFVRGGNPSLPIDYEVEVLRDGRSFSIRRVLAKQEGKAIFCMSCSFHTGEAGVAHQPRMPDVPGPEQLPDLREVQSAPRDEMPPVLLRLLREDRPIDFKPVDFDGMMTRTMKDEVRHFWIRAKGKLPDVPSLHHAVLAYASDMSLLDVALHKHGRGLFDGSHQTASLDHVMWFHRAFRADEWVLYSQESPSRAFSRGFTRGAIFSRSGELLVSVSQEGLLRESTASARVQTHSMGAN